MLTLETLESREVPAVTLVSDTDVSFGNPITSANGQSEIAPRNSISDNGLSLVFVSTGYNLVPGQQRSGGGTPVTTQNVYLYNTGTGATTLVSHAAGSNSTNGNGASFNPVISADGSTIAFYSTSTDLSGTFTPTAGTVQLYLYNVTTGALTLVSHADGQANQPTDATNPFIPPTSANSYGAVNTLGYNAGVDLSSLGGPILGGGLALPSLSADGSYVAWVSNASNLGYTIPVDSVGGIPYTEVYLYDRAANANTLVSHVMGDLTTGASGFASTASISRDGTTVAFTSPAADLTAATNTGTHDQLYVWSRVANGTTGLAAGQTRLASHQGGDVNAGASVPGSFLFGFTADNPPTLSDNGAFVAYYHAGNNLAVGQAVTGASVLNVFRYDVANNTNRLVTHTGDGVTPGNNPQNQIAPFGIGPAEATGPTISSDGRYIAYANNSNNIVNISNPGDRDNVYLYDANAGAFGTNRLVSHAAGSATTANSTGGTAPNMSADGRYVSYIDWAYPNTGTATSAAAMVRVFDRDAANPNTLPPAADTSARVFDPALDPVINGGILAPSVMNRTGTYVAWNGSSANSAANDTNGGTPALDVFLVRPANAITNITLSTTDVPEIANNTVAQLTTQGGAPGATFQYTLLPGVGDNSQFTINTNILRTTAQFTSQSTYNVTIRSTDLTTGMFLDKVFTLNLVTAPTNLQLNQTTVPASANTNFAQFTFTGSPGRTYITTLVSGQGDNSLFSLLNGTLTTGINFPTLGQSTYNVVVNVADSVFPTLNTTVTIPLTLVNAPTTINSTGDVVPALANVTVGTLSTDTGRTYTYSLVPGAGTDNALFSLVGNTLMTGGAAPSGKPAFNVLVRATDTLFPSLTFDQTFSFPLISNPTSVALDDAQVTATTNTVVGSFLVPNSDRDFTYTLVSGTGSSGNFRFTINAGGQLVTSGTFPATAPTTYSIRVRATDTEFPALFRDQQLTITVANAPSTPNLTVPTTLSLTELSTAPFNVTVSSSDATAILTVTVSGVPSSLTFSAGTNNGNGSWTFTKAQLIGLTATALDNGTFALSAVATAAFPGGGPTSTSVTRTTQVSATNVPAVVTASAPSNFNPLNPLSLTVNVTNIGQDAVNSVVVNWGDGTIQTFSGGGTFTHQYAVRASAYTINVTASDEDGTVTVPSVRVGAAFDTMPQAVVAEMYQTLLGLNPDPASVMAISAAVDGGLPLQTVANFFVNTPLFQVNAINNLYLQNLSRPATALELATSLPLYIKGGATAVQANILSSPEFFVKAGGTVEGFVNALELAVYGAPLDVDSTIFLVGSIQLGTSPADIVKQLVLSPFGVAQYLSQTYKNLTGTPIDPVSLIPFVPLETADPDSFLTLLFGSGAVTGKAASV